MSEQALKRIEETHRPELNQFGDFTGICVGCDEEERQVNEADPCDVVKLARALDALCPDLDHVDCDCAVCNGRRTLEEVAGD